MKPTTFPLIFMGTPDFAVPTLSYLLDQKFPIAAVYAQPPRPKGRGHKVTLSPVHLFAQTHGLPVYTPESLKDLVAQQTLLSCIQAHQVQAIVVVAYGLILPLEILTAAPLGCLNVHASLLPLWRGAAPINRCIEAGDTQTGITIMRMDSGVDTGPIYMEQTVPIAPTDTAARLSQTLSLLGGPLIHKTLEEIHSHNLLPQPQPSQGITYAPKLTSTQMHLDFSQSAQLLEQRVRAFSPLPGARFIYENTLIKVLEATSLMDPLASQPIGTIMKTPSLAIQCAQGSLLIPLVVQKEGGRPLSIEDFQRGFNFVPGSQVSLSFSLPNG